MLDYPFLKSAPDTAVSTALRFTLSAPGVHTAIVGTTKPDRWQRNAASLEAGRPPTDRIREIRARWARGRDASWRRAGLIPGDGFLRPLLLDPLAFQRQRRSTGAGQRLLDHSALPIPQRARVFSGSTLPTPPHGATFAACGRRRPRGARPPSLCSGAPRLITECGGSARCRLRASSGPRCSGLQEDPIRVPARSRLAMSLTLMR